MLSHRLSKILAEKNVPNDEENWWVKSRGEWFIQDFFLYDDKKIPAYPEIALFKYAKVIWGDDLIESFKHHFILNNNKHFIPEYKKEFEYRTHKLADLFSSGASAETIENYVLESLG